MGINTFLRPGTRGLYNLYIVDPSEQQIRAYSPAADGSGFPAKPTAWLATARDVSKLTSTYVDGDVFAAEDGAMLRFVGGKSEGWDAKEPKDQVLRPAPSYSIIASGTARREGDIYGFDRPNARVVALAKSDGTYHGQYRLAGEAPDWTDLRGDVRRPRRRRRAGDPRLDVQGRGQPGDPRRRPGPDDDGQPGALQLAQRRSSQGQPEAHQEALTGAVP